MTSSGAAPNADPKATDVTAPLPPLYTASYQAISPELAVPVRTSIGVPTWITYPLVDWLTVAPWGLLDVQDAADFRRRYRHRLHQRTPRILRELAELRAAYAGWPLALLCYERDPADCHRALLAEWIEQHIGEEVREL